MDAEGAPLRPRGGRLKKLMVFLLVQILLVAACVFGNFYIYWRLQHLAHEEEVHMQFGAISDIKNNRTLLFQHVSSSYMMDLDETKTKIQVRCTGPYILYMDLCYISLDKVSHGDLQLRVVGSSTPLHSFPLFSGNETCKRMHSVVYLRENDHAMLDLFSRGQFKIKNITVGLNYELGRRCEF